MIDFQDINIQDYLINANVYEQRIVEFNRSESLLLAYDRPSNPIKPQIVAPEVNYISPATIYVFKKLNNGTLQEKSECLNTMLKDISDGKAVQYLDESINDSLFNIVNENISKYKAPSAKTLKLRQEIQEGKQFSKEQSKKILAYTDREIAYANKIKALGIIAKLQNVLYEEMKSRADISLSFSQLPVVPKLIRIYKTNNDEQVRAGAIGALNLLSRPEFDNDLKLIFNDALKSDSLVVQMYAKQALYELENKNKKK